MFFSSADTEDTAAGCLLKFKMPSLVRKLVVFAAIDGLILQQSDRGQRASSNGNLSLHIDYKTRKITSLAQVHSESTVRSTSPCLEAYGLVGMFRTWFLYLIFCIVLIII